jgi:hypothetical protein
VDNLRAQHQQLAEAHRPVLAQAGQSLLQESSWSLHCHAVLLSSGSSHPSRIVPVGELSQWLEHLPSDLDAFVRLRQGGMAVEQARAQCLAEQGEPFRAAWDQVQDRHPLVTHDNLAEFAALSQKGFARTPRELLVVVQWPQQVTAFLLRAG